MTGSEPRTGTNYAARRRAALVPTPGRVLAVAAADLALCTGGVHDIRTVPGTRVVYTLGGTGRTTRRRATGEKYCRRCDQTVATLEDTLCQGTFPGRHGEYLCAADVEPGARFCSAHPDQEGH